MRYKPNRNGDVRVRKVFLWLPQYDKNINRMRWLESAEIKEKYFRILGIEDIHEGWETVEFLDTKKGKQNE